MTGLTSEAPATGCFYYVVTSGATNNDRRYVQSVARAKDQNSSPIIQFSSRILAKRFSSLAVCRSYCDFLNRAEGLPEFLVVME